MKQVPTIEYQAGEVIIQEGEPSNNIYLIIDGKVKITKNSGKKEILLATQGKNTIFGEMTLIDGKRRSANVIALEKTFCYQCDTIALINQLNKIDVRLITALRSMVGMIRKKNQNLLSSQKSNPSERTDLDIFDEDDHDDNDIVMTRKDIESDKIQKLISNVEPPFIRSLFRVLMATAFK